MRPEERRRHIFELLRQRERISVDELVRTLSTSQEVTRRDLAALVGRGLVSKLHEGVALPLSGERESTFQARVNGHAQEERVVAYCAAGLFGPGDSTLIDTGTTTLLLACELARQSHLMATTNSPLIIGGVGAFGNHASMTDGEYRSESEQDVGALAIEQIARLNAEHAMITVGALNGDGAMDFPIGEAETARTMIAQARQLTVIVDSSKFGWRALFQVFPLNQISRLMVDRKPIGELWGALQQAQVGVHEAPLHVPQV